MEKQLSDIYKMIAVDPFPSDLSLTLGTQHLRYRKRTWATRGEDGKTVELGLRYGENPEQPAALYELIEIDAAFDGVSLIQPGAGLVGGLSERQLLQSGKHPGKTNLTDVDSAVLILRYLTDRPACAIMKHNNPCAVACAGDGETALRNAHAADPLAAFGGCVVVNRPLTRAGAAFLGDVFIEVVVCPEFEDGALELLARRPSLRIIQLERLADLEALRDLRYLDIKSCLDGSLVVQLSAFNTIRSARDFLPAAAKHAGETIRPRREPTAAEYADMVFGWAVEQGVISNSVLFAKNGATVAIGAGGQDRVGVVKQAIAKAFDRLRDRLALERHGILFFELELAVKRGEKPRSAIESIEEETRGRGGDLPGSVLVSDAYFPRRDGVDLALEVGATAICHPGGSVRDGECIQAVNEADPPAAMVFTGQRCFRH